jgi:uncharacterized protein (TIGR03067 family)
MKHITILVAAVILAGGMVGAAYVYRSGSPDSGKKIANDGDAKDSEKLQGTWLLSDVKVAAPEDAEFQAKKMKGLKIIFSGESVTYTGNKKEKDLAGKYFLDPTKSPKEIDIVLKESGKDARVIRGVYELKTERLKICYNASEEALGKGSRRPASLEPGDMDVVMTLEREKP